MRIKKSNKKKLAIIAAVVLVVALGGSATALVINNNSRKEAEKTSQKSDNDKSDVKTDSTKNTTDKSTEATKEDDSSSIPKSSEGDGKTPKQYEGEDVNKQSGLTGIVNYKAVNDGVLSIRATIDQTINNGNANLKLSGPNGQSYSASSSLTKSPSGASFVGFDVTLSKLGNKKSGSWTIEIDVTSGSKSGQLKDNINL